LFLDDFTYFIHISGNKLFNSVIDHGDEHVQHKFLPRYQFPPITVAQS